MTVKVKKAKKCSNCGKVIAGYNKSGLCSYCWRLKHKKDKYWEKKRGERRRTN